MWLRILLICLIASFASAASVQWNASVVDETHGAPDGYRVYYGLAAGQLTTTYDNGPALEFGIPETWNAGTYYFGVRAYNASGESGWATTDTGQEWVAYTKSDPPPILPPALARDVRIVFEQIEDPPIMAVSVPQNIQTASAATGASISLSSYAVGADANRVLIVQIMQNYYSSGDRCTGVTFGGTALTNIAQSPSTDWGQCSAWQLVNPSNTSADIVASWSSSLDGDRRIIVAYWLHGVDQADPIPSADVKSGYSSAASHTISPTNLSSGDLAIGLGSTDNSSSTYSVTTGTLIYEGYVDNWTDHGSGYNTGTGTVSVVLEHANSGTGWVGFRIKASTGGSTSSVPVFMRSYRARRQ